MYQPVLDAVGGSLPLTALFAVLPLLSLFVMLGVFRVTAWKASLVSLVVALLVAILAYSMPAGQAVLSGTQGAVFGFFPILWIVINAIWIYNMTVKTGHFDVLRRSFARVSDDQRIQAIIIAFCFGALLEALAGFGTPVAITSVMLLGLGYRPHKAATVGLVANTAPVAFGALAVPITTLATVTNIDADHLGAIVGRETPILAIFVPLALVYIIDGRRGVSQVWPAAIACGIAFGIAQFAVSNYFSLQLADIIASLVGAGAVLVLLRVWQPAETYTEAVDEVVTVDSGTRPTSATGSAGGGTAGVASDTASTPQLDDSPREVARAYAPYVIIVVVFSLAQITAIKNLLDKPTALFQWPGLHLNVASGDPSTLPAFNFNWLGATGTLLLIAGVITMPVIGIAAGKALRSYLETYRQLAFAILTVMAVLALAYVMNASGQTATLGTWMAEAGKAFAVLSPILGWIGVAVTGSDTSSNSLFGGLQVTAATQAGLPPDLMAAANSSGGVLGKMISPQNLAIAAAAVGLAGKEGDIFRKVFVWAVIFLALMCVIVVAQATFLSGMVPSQ